MLKESSDCTCFFSDDNIVMHIYKAILSQTFVI